MKISIAEYKELLKQEKPSKYHAQPTTVDGIRFDSKAESEYYADLMLLKRAGEIEDIKLQPEFILQHEPKIVYRADFCITWKYGRREVIDVKGVQTKEFRIKKKLFKARYPDLTLRLVRKSKGGGWEDVS